VVTLWNLTSVIPLVKAVRQFVQQWPALAADLELVFAGRRTGEQQEQLDSLKGLPCRVVEHPYLDHDGAIELLRAADGLCVLLSDLPAAERCVPAKIFEYMAARRPILSIAPAGEVGELLQDYPGAHVFGTDDVGGIAAFLRDEVLRHREGRSPDLESWDASPYDRRSQTYQLAQILESLTDRPSASGLRPAARPAAAAT